MKWSEHDDEPPIDQALMDESGRWTDQWILIEQAAGGFDRLQVAFGDVQVRLDRVPLILAFHVRNEGVGLLNAHAPDVSTRARTRLRISAKSLLVNGVTG